VRSLSKIGDLNIPQRQYSRTATLKLNCEHIPVTNLTAAGID